MLTHPVSRGRSRQREQDFKPLGEQSGERDHRLTSISRTISTRKLCIRYTAMRPAWSRPASAAIRPTSRCDAAHRSGSTKRSVTVTL